MDDCVKLEFCWRTQNVGDARTMEYLPKKAVYRSGTNPRERAGRSGSSEESLISGIMLLGLEFALLSFSLALVQYFITLPLSFPLWNGSVYSVPLHVGSI